MDPRITLGLMAVFAVLVGCVRERCYQDEDCPGDQVCGADGRCRYPCVQDEDCGPGFECLDHRCRPKPPPVPVTCPDDMVVVADSFCVDRYEASRPDADADHRGTGEDRATSRPGVLPWLVPDNATAEAACEAAGKRLCTAAEWETACRGPDGTVYAYGDTYDPEICNGIETFGPGKFHLTPTGAFPDCTNEWGLYDINGNVWEHVLGGDARSVRGGAFNCSDSRTFHRCDYVPRTWTPAALGFRCCLVPGEALPDTEAQPVPDEAFPEPGRDAFDVPDGQAEAEAGCVEPDPGPQDPGRDPDPGLEDLPQDLGTDEAAGDLPGDVPADPGFDRDDDSSADLGGAEDGQDLGPGDLADLFGEDAFDPGPRPPCPADMVLVAPATGGAVCVDRYEASHEDATGTSQGTSPVPASRAGVLPWFPVTVAQARAGCEAAGKRLCTPAEWFDACRGPDQTAYGYGDSYSATTCNGIDAFCHCDPYPHCYPACGADFHVVPTGSFSECTNEWGLLDVNGNVWEAVEAGDGLEHFRGGAYNCGDSEALHRCDYDATWNPSARGFRCCKDPAP